MPYQWDVENRHSYENRMGHYRTKTEFEFIDSYLTQKMKILDMGGGSGRFAIPLHKAGHDVTVMDRDDEAIEILRQRCPDINYLQGDFEKIEIYHKYDIIIYIEVLGYMKNLQNVFQKVHSLLYDNGIFIFTATNLSSWKTIIRNSIRPDYGYIEMSTKKYFEFIAKNSFITEQCTGFNWIPLDLGSNSKLVDCFSYFEKRLRLNRWITQSPHLLFAVRKV